MENELKRKIDFDKEITLRDYFAIRIMVDYLKNETDNYAMFNGKTDKQILVKNAAKIAYEIADYMIQVR